MGHLNIVGREPAGSVLGWAALESAGGSVSGVEVKSMGPRSFLVAGIGIGTLAGS